MWSGRLGPGQLWIVELGGGNQRMVPLEFGCTVRLIQESAVKDNSSVVFWLAHSVVATKVRIQISE